MPVWSSWPELGLLVGEEERTVDRGVLLTAGVVDPRGREEGVHAEGPGLVRDDRDDALPDLGIAHQLAQDPDEGHGRRRLLVSALAGHVVGAVCGQDDRPRSVPALGDEAAQLAASLEGIDDLWCVWPRVVERRGVGVPLDVGIADRDLQQIAEGLEIRCRQLLHLVRGVAGLEVRAEAVALDGLREHHARATGPDRRGVVGRIHLAVVVPAAAQPPDLVVGEVLDEPLGRRRATEEVLADVAAGLTLVGLVVPVQRLVHDAHQVAGRVARQERVPLPAPDHLEHVPPRTAEEGLELLDDLAVAPDRPVEPLQVAVHDERQVVEAVVGGQLQQSSGLRLVHLAVPEERPHVLVGGVLDATVAQVTVELRLVDRVHRADPHRDRGELPEGGQQPRVRIGRQPVRGLGLLLTEAVQVHRIQPTLEKAPGVHPGRRVALEEDVVTAAGVVGTTEEVVEADLVERGCSGIGRDVPSDPDLRTLGPLHEHGSVPTHQSPEAPLQVLVAREGRLVLDPDRVEVVRRDRGVRRHACHGRALRERTQHLRGAAPSADSHHLVEGLCPLGQLLGVRWSLALSGFGHVGRPPVLRNRVGWGQQKPAMPAQAASAGSLSARWTVSSIRP